MSLALMFVAWLLYGAMPVLASFPPPVTVTTGTDHATMSDKNDNMSGHPSHCADPCPHCGSAQHAPFCAACLVLPAVIDIADGGRPAVSQILPQIMNGFAAAMPAPPEPPPRS